MSRSLAARITKLEAKHRKDAAKVVGVIGGTPEPYVEEVDGVLHLRFPETPTGEPFEVVALRQQRALQDELAALSLTEAPKTKPQAPHNVGNEIAPLKPGKKQRKFVEVEGVGEIEIATFKGFAR
jgi:hypothetical protein